MAAQPTAPQLSVNYSTRVDKVGWRPRVATILRAILALIIMVITLIPVVWMAMTAFKPVPDASAAPPVVFFTPTLEGFVNLFSQRRQLNNVEVEVYKQRTDLSWADKIELERQQAIIGQSQFTEQVLNSLIIAGASTVFSVG